MVDKKELFVMCFFFLNYKILLFVKLLWVYGRYLFFSVLLLVLVNWCCGDNRVIVVLVVVNKIGKGVVVIDCWVN